MHREAWTCRLQDVQTVVLQSKVHNGRQRSVHPDIPPSSMSPGIPAGSITRKCALSRDRRLRLTQRPAYRFTMDHRPDMKLRLPAGRGEKW
jgi:hypothetical protein